MKIIQPYSKIITKNPPLDLIEYGGRISHRSEEEMREDTWEKFINAVVMRHGDWSITEHASISVEVVTDRGITHEIVRHRIAAYTQESTRFVNYAKKMPPSFIYPKPDVLCPYCNSEDQPTPQGITSTDFHCKPWVHGMGTLLCSYEPIWLSAIQVAEAEYKNLLELGWRPQEARSVFPNALASKILITYNLRMWRHFFIMRTTKEAHPQLRQISIPLLAEFKKLVPILYDDIIPESRQIDNLRLPE